MSRFRTVVVLSALTALAAPLTPARADAYVTTNLVTSNAALFPAEITDPTFINPWGMSLTATSPLWVSVTGPGTATLYRGDVHGSAFTQVNPPIVSIPGGRVTGQVVNTGGFQLANGTSANFIYSARSGSISAWNGGAGTTAQVLTTTAGNYTGLAITPTGTSPGTLYAANNKAGGTIDVFQQTSAGTLTQITPTGTFTPPGGVPSGLAPFNVQQIGGLLYVTFDNPATYGNPNNLNGLVDVFDLNGNFIRSAADPSHLAAPWGVAIAPSNFGPFSNDLLVANFNNNQINAFDPNTGAFLGMLDVAPGGTGLWGLQFGNGTAGSTNTLFVADGFNDQAGGLLFAIDPTPEPGTLGLFLVGGAGLWLVRRRRARPA